MLLIINNGIGFAIKRGEAGLAQPLVTFYRSVSKKKGQPEETVKCI